jgi:DNA-binding PadR family transcriptional regulator
MGIPTITVLQFFLLDLLRDDEEHQGAEMLQALIREDGSRSRASFSQAMKRMEEHGYVTMRKDEESRFAIKPNLYRITDLGHNMVVEWYTFVLERAKQAGIIAGYDLSRLRRR